jgi:hypothetical protein
LGEREVQEAQKRADRRSRKATERLEKRAGAVARAEAQLITLTDRLARMRAKQVEASRETRVTPAAGSSEQPDGG